MRVLLICIGFLYSISGFSTKILIPMDEGQSNHLKAYGIMYYILQAGGEGDWLLNYKGGSFAFDYTKTAESECIIRDVSFEVISDGAFANILNEMGKPEVNQDVVHLEKIPKIAVYSPKSKQPWDDAVTLVLTFAEIPYDIVYDQEVMDGKLPEYDWLHLHHEDFTGQLGKFYAAYRNADWYKNEFKKNLEMANQYGFEKISELKLEVAKKIKQFVVGGGFLFAMCSAADSYDIALAAQDVDICEKMFDGDPADPNAQKKLDYSQSFAFRDFILSKNPYEYEYSNIDATQTRKVPEKLDFFSLFEFSAKWDPIPTMLTQNHKRIVKGFHGQTTAFVKGVIKPHVLILGENQDLGEVRYLHGELEKGMWTFYGGHDPEDYKHYVGDPPTDLYLHPNSPGYRLILNNVLFPAAKEKKQKT